jgi:hypothetical protein
MRCDECRFYKNSTGKLGECGRFPPVLVRPDVMRAHEYTTWWQPTVRGLDWCGEFQSMEPEKTNLSA